MSSLLRLLTLAVLLLAAVGLSLPAQAEDEPEAQAEVKEHTHAVPPAPERTAGEYAKEVWNRDLVFGNWGGLKDDLAEHGVGVKLRMAHFYQNNASGGIRKDDEYGGKMDYQFAVDANKLLGTWPGLFMTMHVESRWGDDIGKDVGAFSLPNANLLWPKPGDYQSTQITGLLLGQNLPLSDGTFTLLAGKMNALDLVDGFFPNVAGGFEGFMNVNSLVVAWPWFRFVNLSFWGGGGWYTNAKGQIVAGGIAFGQDNVSTTWDVTNSFESGVGFFGFVRQYWEIGDLEGYFLAAAGGATRDYPAFGDTDWSVLLSTDSAVFIGLTPSGKKKKPWSVAGYLYQELWKGDEGQKVYIFGAGTIARESPSFARWNVFTAIEAIGVLPKRGGDRMGISGYYNGLSDDFRKEAKLVGVRMRDFWGFEGYYNFQINKWLHLTANLQLLRNEIKQDGLAVIPGGRLVIDF